MIACKIVGNLMNSKKAKAALSICLRFGHQWIHRRQFGLLRHQRGCGHDDQDPGHRVAPNNVRVNAIGPSLVITQGTIHIQNNPELAEKYKKEIPLGRLGAPEDLVGAAIYLASDASSFVTGHTLFVDGGLHRIMTYNSHYRH